jgi:5-methylcytosine-specific restriction endonuclease McrA
VPIRPELRKYYGRVWRLHERPATLVRDCYECVRCAAPDRPMGYYTNLEVAHLDGDPSNRSPENRATFCRACHRAHDYPQWSKRYRAWLEAERIRRIDALDAGRPILQYLKEAV